MSTNRGMAKKDVVHIYNSYSAIKKNLYFSCEKLLLFSLGIFARTGFSLSLVSIPNIIANL